MRPLAMVLLLAAETGLAAEPEWTPRQRVELLRDAAELATWTSEHRWGLWAVAVLAHGVAALLVPGAAFLAVARDDAQTATMFPGVGYEQRSGDMALAGGALMAFGFAAIVTAIAMFTHQAQGTWHEDAYWELRQ
jgi:hypothetical protein